MSSLVLITLLTFNAICSSIAEIHCFEVSRLMLIPLKATAIYRINKEIEQVLLYSCMQLAIASPYATSILCVLAVASYLIVGKDSSKGGVEVEETFIDSLIEANWYCSCSNVGSVLEVSSDFGRISLRFFCCISRCDCMEFGVCFLFIRGSNKRKFAGLYSC
jgi:hypothetical protein